MPCIASENAQDAYFHKDTCSHRQNLNVCMGLPSDNNSCPSIINTGGLQYVLIRMVAISGQLNWILWRATFLFRQLKALVASTNNTPWVPSSWNISFTAWTAASQPAIWFPHNCTDLTEDWMSLLSTAKTAFAMMRRGNSPIPIGRTSRQFIHCDQATSN